MSETLVLPPCIHCLSALRKVDSKYIHSPSSVPITDTIKSKVHPDQAIELISSHKSILFPSESHCCLLNVLSNLNNVTVGQFLCDLTTPFLTNVSVLEPLIITGVAKAVHQNSHISIHKQEFGLTISVIAAIFQAIYIYPNQLVWFLATEYSELSKIEELFTQLGCTLPALFTVTADLLLWSRISDYKFIITTPKVVFHLLSSVIPSSLLNVSEAETNHFDYDQWEDCYNLSNSITQTSKFFNLTSSIVFTNAHSLLIDHTCLSLIYTFIKTTRSPKSLIKIPIYTAISPLNSIGHPKSFNFVHLQMLTLGIDNVVTNPPEDYYSVADGKVQRVKITSREFPVETVRNFLFGGEGNLEILTVFYLTSLRCCLHCLYRFVRVDLEAVVKDPNFLTYLQWRSWLFNTRSTVGRLDSLRWNYFMLLRNILFAFVDHFTELHPRNDYNHRLRCLSYLAGFSNLKFLNKYFANQIFFKLPSIVQDLLYLLTSVNHNKDHDDPLLNFQRFPSFSTDLSCLSWLISYLDDIFDYIGTKRPFVVIQTNSPLSACLFPLILEQIPSFSDVKAAGCGDPQVFPRKVSSRVFDMVHSGLVDVWFYYGTPERPLFKHITTLIQLANDGQARMRFVADEYVLFEV
ncbi:hypothetical protein P9112_004800 [Eukaryota sp. TZLM1-RC]